MPLYAGVSEANITPPPGVWMSGYAGRPTGCTGVHDELHARALVLQDGDRCSVAIVACDLIGFDFEVVDRVRSAIGSELGTEPSSVMLCATHTHGGPTTRTFGAMGPSDAAYMSVLERKLVGVARQAAEALQPASLAYGRSAAQIGVNRRQATGAGTVLGCNWGGPVSPVVHAIVVRDSRGGAYAVLVSHACHAVTMGGDNLRITADYPGAACTAIKEMTAGAVLPIYLQGCCGDVNPLQRGTWEAVAHNGRVVADAAIEAMEAATSASNSTLRVQEAPIELPYLPPPPADVAERDLALAEASVALARERGHAGAVMNAEGLRDHAAYVLRLAQAGRPPDAVRSQVQCITLGEARVLGLPFEPFVEYALHLEAAHPGPVIVAGYTNGEHGYLPTAAEYARGGYELETAQRYYGTLMLDPACERIVLEACKQLLAQS